MPDGGRLHLVTSPDPALGFPGETYEAVDTLTEFASCTATSGSAVIFYSTGTRCISSCDGTGMTIFLDLASTTSSPAFCAQEGSLYSTSGRTPGLPRSQILRSTSEPDCPSTLSSPHTIATGAQATFDWTLADRFRLPDPTTGSLVYKTDPNDPQASAFISSSQGFEVDFTVTDPANPNCDPLVATYEWTIDGAPRNATDPMNLVGDCQWSAMLPQGQNQISLTVTQTKGNRTAALSSDSPKSILVKDWLIANIGDSVGSGEGVPDVPYTSPQYARWENAQCHRSATNAASALAAAQIEKDDPHTSVTFINLACSGASILDGLIGGPGCDNCPYAGYTPTTGVGNATMQSALPPQVDQLTSLTNGQRTLDALIVNAGANDLGWSAFLRYCARWPLPGGASLDCKSEFVSLQDGHWNSDGSWSDRFLVRTQPTGEVDEESVPICASEDFTEYPCVTLDELVNQRLAGLRRRYSMLADALNSNFPERAQHPERVYFGRVF